MGDPIQIPSHSLCVDLAKESNFFYTEHNAFGDPNNVARLRRITFYSDNNSMNEFFRLNPKPKKLRALFFFTKDPLIISQMAHFDFKLLQVLVVVMPRIHLGYVTIRNKIGNMSCLRYLRLEGRYNGELPNSIVKLKRLETVDIRNSTIILPFGVWESKQLRHVHYGDLAYTSNSCFSKSPNMYSLPPNDVQTLMWIHDEFFEPRLSKLRKLGIKDVSDSTIKVLAASSPMSKALEVLKLDFNRNPSEQINLSSYPNIVKLRMTAYTSNSFMDWKINPKIEAFPPNLVKLTLVRVMVDGHLLAMLKKLPKLRILKMVRCQYDEREMDLSCQANGDGFLQLELLHIVRPFELLDDVCIRSPIRLPERLKKRIVFENF